MTIKTSTIFSISLVVFLMSLSLKTFAFNGLKKITSYGKKNIAQLHQGDSQLALSSPHKSEYSSEQKSTTLNSILRSGNVLPVLVLSLFLNIAFVVFYFRNGWYLRSKK